MVHATHSGRYQAQMHSGIRLLALATLIWVITTAVLGFGPIYVWNGNRTLTWVALAVNLAAGAGMILANKNHLMMLDELQRKVQLEAMGITLGVLVVVIGAYPLVDELFPVELDLGHLAFLLAPTYVACLLVGLRRYR